MLQQTTTTTVLSYFHNFLEKFPTVHHLARESQEGVLHLWQGLGYYSRGRNLHKGAQVLSNQGFPRTYEEWLKIPGIGPYTAGALCAIGMNQPVMALDAHGWRIFSRLGNFHHLSWRKEAEIYAKKTLPKEHIWAYTQSLMDFGNEVCRAKNPLCFICPLNHLCGAYKENTLDLCPPKALKKEKPKRYVLGHIYENPQGEILLEKNLRDNLLKGLWRIPLGPWLDKPCDSWKTLPFIVHHFTHFQGYCFLKHHKNTPVSEEDSEEKRWIFKEHLLNSSIAPPFSTLMKKVLRAYQENNNDDKTPF